MSIVLDERSPDANLWQLVCQGSVPAFEVVVRRHQSAVAAVAYNACGDLATSEDVAQEAFWTAWRQRTALREPARLCSWLCGIARNLGKNARRRAPRAAASLEGVGTMPAVGPGPAEQAVSREEESLVWRALEQIPDGYREPLILFYREGQAVAEVAQALDLSADAVKQRLSRGRNLLRDQVAVLVESALQRSRPGPAFSVGVLTGVTAAAKGAGLPIAAASTVSGGIFGGLIGVLGGLGGAWLGSWLPAQLADSKAERSLLTRMGKRMMLVSILFILVLLAGVLLLVNHPGHFGYCLFGAIAWMASYWTYIAIESVLAARATRRLREQGGEPNDAPMRQRVEAIASQYRGRVYRTPATFLGLPLIEINVSDPMPRCQPSVARGWIAIGDDARGVLLAIGGKARGLIAIGGIALGGISFGGLAVGIIAIGGAGFGVLGIGGLGIGIIGIGGLAIGWQAGGGGALAWDTAVGGGAAAMHAAYGGGAFAQDFAVGGDAIATHANDEAAKAVLLDHPLVLGIQAMQDYFAWYIVGIVALSLLPTLVMTPLMYRKKVAGNLS
jgi:zinc protease